MTNDQSVTPIRETVQHFLGNAAQIAELWAHDSELADLDARKAFAAIRDHLKKALEQLGEPSFEAIQAAAILLREYEQRAPHTDGLRDVRDICAAIIHAQVTGTVPPTWEKS